MSSQRRFPRPAHGTLHGLQGRRAAREPWRRRRPPSCVVGERAPIRSASSSSDATCGRYIRRDEGAVACVAARAGYRAITTPQRGILGSWQISDHRRVMCVCVCARALYPWRLSLRAGIAISGSTCSRCRANMLSSSSTTRIRSMPQPRQPAVLLVVLRMGNGWHDLTEASWAASVCGHGTLCVSLAPPPVAHTALQSMNWINH